MAAHQAPSSLGFSRQEHEWVAIFPLRCMKVKSESEVAQSCLTLSDPMDCRPPGSSVHVIFPGKSTGVGCHCLLRNISYWFKILAFPAMIGKYWIMTTFKITLFIWIFKFHVLLGWQSCLIEEIVELLFFNHSLLFLREQNAWFSLRMVFLFSNYTFTKENKDTSCRITPREQKSAIYTKKNSVWKFGG